MFASHLCGEIGDVSAQLKSDTILNPVMSLPEMYPKRHGCTQIPVSMYPVEDDTRERGKQEAA